MSEIWQKVLGELRITALWFALRYYIHRGILNNPRLQRTTWYNPSICPTNFQSEQRSSHIWRRLSSPSRWCTCRRRRRCPWWWGRRMSLRSRRCRRRWGRQRTRRRARREWVLWKLVGCHCMSSMQCLCSYKWSVHIGRKYTRWEVVGLCHSRNYMCTMRSDHCQH